MHATVPAAAFSAVITAALFYVMQALVAVQPGAVVEARERSELKFVRVPPVEDLRTDDDPVAPEPVSPPPVLPAVQQPGTGDKFGVRVPVRPQPPVRQTFDGPVGFLNDGPLVTVLNVQPQYPVRAIQQGLEGYVIVSLDVGADGTVTDARVLESSHAVFEAAAIDAALRCRYKPRVVDGIPQPSSGLKKIFRFELDN